MLDGADVLITGGTGSFGRALVAHLLELRPGPRRVIVYSRDELKQFEMQRELKYQGEVEGERLRFFLGDVRDRDRLTRAFMGVDYVVHAAALKQVPACEYNPEEAVKTNVLGAGNVIAAAIDSGVKRVIALSTDKACNPANLYGASKLVAEKYFQAGNTLAGALDTRFAVVRYGNVLGSRGSVLQTFRRQVEEGGPITITDRRMTRFWITLPQAVRFVLNSLRRMHGGEIFVPRLPTVRVVELAEAVAPGEMERKVVGMRPGEKIHETLVGPDEVHNTVVWPDCYVINPHPSTLTPGIERLDTHMAAYTSDANPQQLRAEGVRKLLEAVPA